jgi:hypothetical protein
MGDAAHARTATYTAADYRSPAAWRAARARVVRARLAAMPRMSGSTVVVATSFTDDAAPIGDVDRDGTADVLSLRLDARSPAVVVMSGRTGRVLWSRPDPGVYGAVYVAAPGMSPIVLILSGSGTGLDAFVAGVDEDVFTLTAYRADRGTSLWSTSINGVLGFSLTGFVGAGVGEFDGVLTRSGKSPYLLVDRWSEGAALVAGATSVAPQVIDATTGATVSTGQPFAGAYFTSADPVSDLNGDGADDYVVTASDVPPMVEAISSVNGEPLWAQPVTSASGPATVSGVRGTPDVTGDHKPDLLVGYGDGSGQYVAAWSGATGAPVWSVPGDVGSPLGDIDHDGLSDTRVVTFGFDGAVAYQAITAKGRTAWVRVVAGPHDPAVVSSSYPVGDLNGDGAVDTYLRFTKAGKRAPSGSTPIIAVAVYVVDGRTGRLRVIHDMGLPTGDSLSGHAMTFVLTRPVTHGQSITAFNGATGRAYWHTVFSAPNANDSVDQSVLPRSGGRGSVLGLFSGPLAETIVLLDGRNGSRKWSAAYAMQTGGIGAPALA